jgi:hypothetical protein
VVFEEAISRWVIVRKTHINGETCAIELDNEVAKVLTTMAVIGLQCIVPDI